VATDGTALSVKLHTPRSRQDMRDLLQILHHLFKGIEREQHETLYSSPDVSVICVVPSHHRIHTGK